MFMRAALILTLSFALAPASVFAQENINFSSYEDIETIFQEYSYTSAAWEEGIREVPRLYLSNIPERWRTSVSREISVALKKALFFRLLGPLVLRANEIIIADRMRLGSLDPEPGLSDQDQQWLATLGDQYRVPVAQDDESLAAAIEQLLIKVDIIPPSLALAQAAEESGWGTSRFAVQGNALFGQWTWGGNGIVPREQRSGLGDYKIAAFETPQESIVGYMNNLNTHPAYADFRSSRAQVRSSGRVPRGTDLVDTLKDYSERGQDYIDTLGIIIRVNKLDAADEAYLADHSPLILTPVGEGSD